LNSAIRNRLTSVLSLFLMVTASHSAWPVDVVPTAGFRFGGEVSSASDATASTLLNIDSTASFGGVIDFPLPPAQFGLRAVELYFSRQQTTVSGDQLQTPAATHLDVSVLHIGLADTVPSQDPRLSWRLIGSGGATRFETTSGRDTRPSLGLGGAVVWMPSTHVGLRGDLRALITFTGSSGSALACNGGCSFFYSGSVVIQGEASAGIVLRF
jgi:hypothetical protein